jgi:hypothetical protein
VVGLSVAWIPGGLADACFERSRGAVFALVCVLGSSPFIPVCAGTHKEFEMLRKLSKRGVLLFVGVLALAAFVMPSAVSAASWGVVGSTHVLDSSNLQFLDPVVAGGAIGAICPESEFHVDVSSATVLTITRAVFKNCMGTTSASSPCTVTLTATKLPWTVTAPSFTNIQIHNVNILALYENTPTTGGGNCNLAGISVTLTGTLTGGVWDSTNHQVTYTVADGLTAHSAFGVNHEVFFTGTIKDTTQSLVLS